MTTNNKELFRRHRQDSVYAIKTHMNFLRGKLDQLEQALENDGAHYALVTSELIAASTCIPNIVKELGSIREHYQSYQF